MASVSTTKRRTPHAAPGPIDKSTIKPGDIPKVSGGGGGGHAAPVADGNKPSIDSCINTYDFEAIASRICPEQGWVYYSSGADDEITLRENHNAGDNSVAPPPNSTSPLPLPLLPKERARGR